MPFVENETEFGARQACEFIDVVPADSPEWERGTRLFANGARCVTDGFGWISKRFEPPTDRFELIRAKRIFVKAKLDREVGKWKNFRKQCDEMIHQIRQYGPYTPPPPADAAERLARGAERIKALKAQVAEFDEELKQSPDAKMRDKQAELSRAQDNKLKEQFRAIEEIKI
jgi:hypothetical protein